MRARTHERTSARQKDDLFSEPTNIKPFEFDEKVAQVFDDMLVRSIPCYGQVQGQILSLIQTLHPHARKIYDLGTSTGSLVFYLARHLDDSQVQYVGIDNSADMIAKAKENLAARHLEGQIDFFCEDICQVNYRDADVVVLNYVLQFLDFDRRTQFLKSLHDQMSPNSVLIVSEKTLSPCDKIGDAFTNLYEGFKLQNHYTKLEIAQKRKALENVLKPLSLQNNLEILGNAGFTDVEPFFSWFNFASYVALR